MGTVLSADMTLQTIPWAPGELRSLAELLDEVKDGDDREEKDEVTVRRNTRKKLNDSANLVKPGPHLDNHITTNIAADS